MRVVLASEIVRSWMIIAEVARGCVLCQISSRAMVMTNASQCKGGEYIRLAGEGLRPIICRFGEGQPVALQDFSLKHALRVRWAEVDQQGIVFNGHYLTYFDVAITEYWRAIGFTYPDQFLARDCDTFVVRASLEYHGPARFDDLLQVCVRVGRLGNSSIQFVLEIHRDEVHLITGEVIYVNASAQTRRPKSIPAEMRAAMVEYERIAPAAK